MRGVCLEALELYRGTFLPRPAEGNWVGLMTVYYHTLCQKLAVYMAGKLTRGEEYGQAEEICQRAIGIDRLVGGFHYYWIYAAYGQGEQETALERYKDTADMSYRECLMMPSEHLRESYKMINSNEQEVVTDPDAIQENLDMDGVGEGHGVYQCEYAVLKRLTQLGYRDAEHSGDSVCLYLLIVGDRKGRIPKPEIQVRAMERLRASIQKDLRSSDVYTRYSISQSILLLSSATSENSGMVTNRILPAFNKSYVCKDVAVNYSLDVLRP